MSFLWAGRRRPWMPCGRPGRCSRPAARTRRSCSRWRRSTSARISGRADAGRRRGRWWKRRRAPCSSRGGRVRRWRARPSWAWRSRARPGRRTRASPGAGTAVAHRSRSRHRRLMEPKEVLDELKAILVSRLKFDPRRAAETTEATPLPKGVDGSIGLDSLDFIELSIAIEERFGIALDENQDLTEHFASFDTLSRFIAGKLRSA